MKPVELKGKSRTIKRFTQLRDDYQINVDRFAEAIPLIAIFDVQDPGGVKLPTPKGTGAPLGTGFFVSPYGIFITAKHVVEDHVGLIPQEKLRLLVFAQGTYFDLKIRHVVMHPNKDIAVGCIMIDPSKRAAPTFKLADKVCPSSEVVLTYGYPNSTIQFDGINTKIDLHPAIYDGLVHQYHQHPHDRVSAYIEMPYYSHSAPLGSGISGGPLIRLSDSAVYAINSVSMATDPVNQHAPAGPGISTDVREAFDLRLPFVEGTPTLRELAKDSRSGVQIISD